jgi:hypothetical protein
MVMLSCFHFFAADVCSHLSGVLCRVDHRQLVTSLPGKVETVLMVRLTPVQRALYMAFLRNRSALGVGLFDTYALMTKACSIPLTLASAL